MVLSGKEFSEWKKEILKREVEELKKYEIYPELRIVTTGEDDASKIYVRNKTKLAEEIGIKIFHREYNYIEDFYDDYINNNFSHRPTIIQKPYNCGLWTKEKAEEEIGMFFNKYQTIDVDGFGYYNVACLALNQTPYHYPCTPKGIIDLLDYYKLPPDGKLVVIIGRGNLVGKPLARMLENRNATVVLCHTKTDYQNLKYLCARSDIIVTATGKPDTIPYDSTWKQILYKKILIDVGINRNKEGKLVGDINPEMYKYACAYTPVPGGVGLCTTITLMENVVNYYKMEW